MASMGESARGTVPWVVVATVVGCGVVASLQIGKAVIAAPMLKAEFELGLAAVGWVTGIFAVLGLVGGIPSGALVARIGDRRTLIQGLCAIMLGAGLGALSETFAMFLASRVLEGFGFLLVVVAGPAVLQRLVLPKQRDVAFSLWSCFMPAGMALAMLAGPLFGDWRSIWWASASLAVAFIVATIVAIRKSEAPTTSVRVSLVNDAIAVVGNRGPMLLALCFAFYSLMFFALFSFLPVLLMERMEVTHGTAGLLSALATAVNIIGNLLAGHLLFRGAGRSTLIVSGSVAMGISAIGIFLPLFGDTETFLLCLLFSAAGGLIPATLISSASVAAPSAALVPMVVGLLMQGSNLGQVVGPVAVGGVIDRFGWPSAAGIVVIAALCAAICAAALRRSFPHT